MHSCRIVGRYNARQVLVSSDSAFVRTQARQLFILIQSLLDNPSEEIQKRFSTTEGLQAYTTEYIAGKVGPRGQESEEPGFGPNKYSGETITLASAVHKELQSK